MGRRSRGEMPRVFVVKPHGHARVRIGGKAYWLGKCPDGKPTPAQQEEAARLWQQYLVEGKPPARKRQAVVTPAQRFSLTSAPSVADSPSAITRRTLVELPIPGSCPS